MRKRIFSLICILIMCLTFIACGKSEDTQEDSYEETTITLDKKGKITETIVESFDKDYYDANELSSEFQSMISEIMVNDSDCDIELKDTHVENGNIYMKLIFSNGKSYHELLGNTLFLGTIKDAYDAGFTMDLTLQNVTTGDLISKVEIMGMQDKHIVIMDEHVRLKSYRPIEYVSANVEVINENEIRVLSEADGFAYIVLDK